MLYVIHYTLYYASYTIVVHTTINNQLFFRFRIEGIFFIKVNINNNECSFEGRGYLWV
jgi:hypothetical protein